MAAQHVRSFVFNLTKNSIRVLCKMERAEVVPVTRHMSQRSMTLEAKLLLSFSTRWRSVVSFMLQLPYPQPNMCVVECHQNNGHFS